MKKNHTRSKKSSDASALLPRKGITEAGLAEGLIAMAAGIRHGPNFSVEDQAGQIVDRILYSKGTPFGPEVFPKCLHQPNGKILTDSGEELQNKFRINTSDIVLDISFGETFRAQDFELLLTKFNEQIVEGVMAEFKIRRILRVGIVRKFQFQSPGLISTLVNRTIGSTLEGINDIALRFSKKIPIEKSFIKQNENDYKTAIFSIAKNPESDDIDVLLDFQRYYDPSLPQASLMEFPKFVKESTTFTHKVFLAWLNNYLFEGSRG